MVTDRISLKSKMTDEPEEDGDESDGELGEMCIGEQPWSSGSFWISMKYKDVGTGRTNVVTGLVT